jgi:hypothetical protein
MEAAPNRRQLANEAKAIVALAFRNGPIEDVHAGKPCPICDGNPKYSHITEQEMKQIMKNAVDRVFRLLSLRQTNPGEYEAQIRFGNLYTYKWDEPTGSADGPTIPVEHVNN